MISFVCRSLIGATLLTPCALAQNPLQPQPEPVPMPPPIVAPADKPYVAPLQLTVDLRNIVDRIEKVHEDVPVEPGAKELVLLYPEWLPGDHEPSGPISALGGITTTVVRTAGFSGCATG